MTVKPRCTRTVVFSCPFLGGCNEEAACFDAGHADRSDRPGTVQGELYLPASVPAVFLHGRFTRRGNCAVMAAPTFVETTMHTHRVFLCLPCMRGRRAVRRAFKHRQTTGIMRVIPPRMTNARHPRSASAIGLVLRYRRPVRRLGSSRSTKTKTPAGVRRVLLFWWS